MKKKLSKLFNFGLNLARTETARDVLISLFGNCLSGFLGLVFTALVARFLSPSKFGQFSTVIAYIIFISATADLGINQGLIYFVGRSKGLKQKTWARLVFKLVILFSLFFSIVAGLLFWPFLSDTWGVSKEFTFLVFGGVFISTLFLFFVYLFQSFKDFIKKALFENIFAISRMIMLLLVLLFFKLDVFMSVFLVLAGETVSLIFGWLASPVKLNKLTSVKLNLIRIKELTSFSKWLALNNLFAQLYGRIDILMLAWLSSSFVTGIYASAARLMLVFPVIISSFSSVIAPRFASFNDLQSMRSYFKKTLLASLGLAAAMGISLIIIAKPLMLIIYGKDYLGAVFTFKVLTLAFLPLLLSIPTVNSLVYFFKKSSILSFISGVQLALVFLLNLIFIPKFLSLGPTLSLLIVNFAGLILGYLFFFREVFKARSCSTSRPGLAE